jgi:hypothetical protein
MKAHLKYAFACGCFAAATSAVADNSISFVSQGGDYVGQGTTWSSTFSDAQVHVQSSNAGVLVTHWTGDPFWRLGLSTSDDRALKPGCYERAQRYALHDANRPGLVFQYNGHGCNVPSGRFKLLDYVRDSQTGEVSSLAVDFVQHCEGLGPALFGKLRYHSSIPLDTPALEPEFQTTGMLHFTSDADDWVGMGQERTYTFDQLLFRVHENDDHGISLFNGNLDSWWTLDLAGPDQRPLTQGTYLDAERYSYQAAGQSGLDYTLDGRSCDRLGGQFAIAAIAHDRIDGLPSRLDATFEQRCEDLVPALRGEIGFATTFSNGPLVDDTLFTDAFDATTPWPLIWACPLQ